MVLKKNKVLAIIQARYESTRFPGKVLKKINNKSILEILIGSNSVMDYANSTFMSSTFWTERIGSVAGLKTLEIMQNIKSWQIISNLGIKIKNKWKSISKKYNIKLNIQELDALPRFDFENKNNLYYKTFISQEFLKEKILASNSIYLFTERTLKILDNYYDILDFVFSKIKKSINDDNSPQHLLNGPICISGLRSKY